MVETTTFVRDTLFFIKNDLTSNVTDPISARRKADSHFIMTSYPVREAEYPIITIKLVNTSATRVGMQSKAMDMELDIEVRIWARNVKEKDELFTLVFNRLKDIQFTTTGSINSNLHDFELLSSVDVEEETIKSRVTEVKYKFYNFT